MNILTNDPSMTAWGMVVIDLSGQIKYADCLRTAPESRKRRIRKSDDLTRRLSEINHSLINIIKEYDIDFIISELPHGSQNASAAIMIGATTGIIQMLGDTYGIGVQWWSEMDAKKCVLQKKGAVKQEMIDAIDKLYNVPWTGKKYKDEAIADALAVYHVSMEQGESFKLLKKLNK